MGPMDIIAEEKKATGCSGYFEPCKTTDDCCGKEPDAGGLSYKCSSGMCMGPMVFNDVCAKQDEPCTSVADCCNTMSSKCKKNGKCKTIASTDPTITDYVGDLFDEILN